MQGNYNFRAITTGDTRFAKGNPFETHSRRGIKSNTGFNSGYGCTTFIFSLANCPNPVTTMITPSAKKVVTAKAVGRRKVGPTSDVRGGRWKAGCRLDYDRSITPNSPVPPSGLGPG